MNVRRIADYMCSLLEADSAAITQLMSHAIPCNEALAAHPTAVIKILDDGKYALGLMGLIAGMKSDFDADTVCACYDDKTGELVGFGVVRADGEVVYTKYKT